MNSREIKWLSRRHFKPDWARYVLVTLIFMVVIIGLNSITGLTFPMGMLLMIPIFLITNALQIVYIRVISQFMADDYMGWLSSILPATINSAVRFGITKILQVTYLLLWFCLFFLPGLYKVMSYALVDYILVDFPDLSAKEVIAFSRRLMRGQKLNWLMLHFRFLGWYLLIPLTFGIASVYVIPYRTVAMIIFYEQCLTQRDLTHELAQIKKYSKRDNGNLDNDEDEWKNF